MNSQAEKEDNMNKGTDEQLNDDLQPEYDLSQLLRDGVRGKYAERYRAGTNLSSLSDESSYVSPTETATRISPGSRVRTKTNPSRCGVITGKQRECAQRIYWQVMFPEGPDFVLEAQLDLIS